MSEADNKPKFERKPNREIFLSMSKDGRFCIVKVVESWILPRNYVQVVLGDEGVRADLKVAPAEHGETKTKGS